jgi:large subunit ribosomal protein L7/L12
MADLKQFAEQLVNLTVKDVNELATILKRRIWYRTCCCCCSSIAGPAAGAGDAAGAEEKTSFDVILKNGDKLN